MTRSFVPTAQGITLALFFLLSTEAGAQTPQVDARYDRLAHELRCLVCQNQSLAESGADLAEDLKKEVRSLITQVKSDDEIKTFLKSRYGDFILYKPPVQSNTLVLWLGPFAALGVGAIVAALFLRKRASSAQSVPTAQVSLTEEDRRELEERLK
jgi:cytochrome c-type biogenesis protein CcmH